MYQTNFTNKTPSANILVNVKITTTESNNLLKYENKNIFDKLCQDGCPNYGNKWSCPPYSRKFSDYKRNYPYATLVLFWCNIDQFSYAKTEYIKIKASNSILKSRIDRFVRNLEQVTDGIMLSNGSCRLCNPCSKKVGNNVCNRPLKMRYSMESLGLDVGRISNDYFDHELLWYQNKKAPTYSSVVSCLLTMDSINENTLDSLVQLLLV